MSYTGKPIFLMSPVRSTMQRSNENFQSYWLPLHSSTDDLLLYHYTNLHGYMGILKTKSLWCTDTSSLNDPMELKYGKKLVVDALNEKIKIEKNKRIKNLLYGLHKYVNAFETILFRVFIACFCKDGNLLSQWRAYAKKGVGYNIGINFCENTKFSHNSENVSNETHMILRKIIYDLDDQKEIILRSIDTIIKEAKNVEKSLDNKVDSNNMWSTYAALETVNILFDIIMSIKNPAFKEEKEWRLIKVIDPNQLLKLIKFREINEIITPYISTLIYEKKENNYYFPLSSIRFGPILDDKITKINLELFIKNIALNKSDIKIDLNKISIESAGYSLR